jgi:hypothetical protein
MAQNVDDVQDRRKGRCCRSLATRRAFLPPPSFAKYRAMMAQVISASVIGSFARRIIGPASA